MSELVRLETSGPAARLTLNRPDRRNALSIDLLAALLHHLQALSSRTDLHSLTLTGEGKAFCAGMDLKAVLNSPADALQLLSLLAECTISLRALPCVTIASVNGAAIGGGCGLACVADIALTHADAKLGFPEVDLGVCPAVVAPWLVSKIGPGPARTILLSGGLLTGTQAHAARIVDTLTPDFTTLQELTIALETRLASGGLFALQQTKRLLNRIDNPATAALVREGAAISAAVIAAPEAQTMLRAQFAK